MNIKDKVEFLKFLINECNPDETIQSASFRLLCYKEGRDFNKKWFHFEYLNDNYSQQYCLLVIPEIDLSIYLYGTIKYLIDEIRLIQLNDENIFYYWYNRIRFKVKNEKGITRTHNE